MAILKLIKSPRPHQIPLETSQFSDDENDEEPVESAKDATPTVDNLQSPLRNWIKIPIVKNPLHARTSSNKNGEKRRSYIIKRSDLPEAKERRESVKDSLQNFLGRRGSDDDGSSTGRKFKKTAKQQIKEKSKYQDETHVVPPLPPLSPTPINKKNELSKGSSLGCKIPNLDREDEDTELSLTSRRSSISSACTDPVMMTPLRGSGCSVVSMPTPSSVSKPLRKKPNGQARRPPARTQSSTSSGGDSTTTASSSKSHDHTTCRSTKKSSPSSKRRQSDVQSPQKAHTLQSASTRREKSCRSRSTSRTRDVASSTSISRKSPRRTNSEQPRRHSNSDRQSSRSRSRSISTNGCGEASTKPHGSASAQSSNTAKDLSRSASHSSPKGQVAEGRRHLRNSTSPRRRGSSQSLAGFNDWREKGEVHRSSSASVPGCHSYDNSTRKKDTLTTNRRIPSRSKSATYDTSSEQHDSSLQSCLEKVSQATSKDQRHAPGRSRSVTLSTSTRGNRGHTRYPSSASVDISGLDLEELKEKSRRRFSRERPPGSVSITKKDTTDKIMDNDTDGLTSNDLLVETKEKESQRHSVLMDAGSSIAQEELLTVEDLNTRLEHCHSSGREINESSMDLAELTSSLHIKEGAETTAEETREKEDEQSIAACVTPPKTDPNMTHSNRNNESSIDLALLIGHMQVVQSLEDLMKVRGKEAEQSSVKKKKNQLSLKEKRLQARWGLVAALESDMQAKEFFRRQYDLSEDEMGIITTHLTLCEELHDDIRWDLIFQIIFPDAGVRWDLVNRVIDPVDVLVAMALQEEMEKGFELLDEEEFLLCDSLCEEVSQRVPPQLGAMLDEQNKSLHSNSALDYYNGQDSMTISSCGKHMTNLTGLIDVDACFLQLLEDLEVLLQNTTDTRESVLLFELLNLVRSGDVGVNDPLPEKLNLEDILDIVSHLKLCEETNTPIRWDLIHSVMQILVPVSSEEFSEATI